MEARFAEIPVGDDGELPPIEAGADAVAAEAWGNYVRTGKLTMPPPGLTVRGILRRNAVQDVSLGEGGR